MYAIAQYHEASHKPIRNGIHVFIPLHNCCVHLCAGEKKTESKFDLLFEVTFKDSRVRI